MFWSEVVVIRHTYLPVIVVAGLPLGGGAGFKK